METTRKARDGFGTSHIRRHGRRLSTLALTMRNTGEDAAATGRDGDTRAGASGRQGRCSSDTDRCACHDNHARLTSAREYCPSARCR